MNQRSTNKISINQQFKSVAFALVLLSSTLPLMSQPLSTQGGFTASDLVQNVLLGGGIQVSNISFQGSPNAIGTFNGSTSNIGLDYGVVMTTGTIFGANGPQGPNNNSQAGVDNGTGGYGLLTNIVSPSQTFNATVISFDFIPQGDSVAFRYVFGSEEYKEYVGTEFNDVFGFFISGPIPGGGNYTNKNIALVPGTSIPVAINNVNHLTNSNYYVDNEIPMGATVQYDGFTKVLTAAAAVIPCSTYTIRLAIADVADGIFDSGVFLEAHSFSSNGVDLSHTITGSPSADTLYESCGTANVTFTWSGDNSSDRVVNYTLLGTAINGVDYEALPGFIVIPAGQSSATLSFNAINDGIPEPLEYIVIQIVDETVCPGVELAKDTIYLANVEPLTVVARPDTALNCNNEVVLLYANVTGGAGDVTYYWNNNAGIGNNIPILARETTTYIVTATDGCGATQSDDVTIYVPNVPPLTLSFSPDTAICPGEEIVLTANSSGGIGDIIYSWSTGAGQVSSITVYPETTTLFSIAVHDSCGNTLTASSLVSVLEPEVSFTYQYLDNRKIRFNSTASFDVVEYAWDFGDGGTSTEADPIHFYVDSGYYTVTLVVTNMYGCTDTAISTIYAYPDFVFYIPNTFTPNLDGLNDIFSGKGMGFVEFEMLIFDRWGGVVYETDDIARGWPGTDRNDEKCQLGVYAYKVQIVTPPGKVYTYIGHINLIR